MPRVIKTSARVKAILKVEYDEKPLVSTLLAVNFSGGGQFLKLKFFSYVTP